MTQDEACDLILWGLYDEETSGVGTGISGLNGFLEAKECDDHRLVGRAGKYLNDLGFLTNYGGVSGFRYHAGISAKAFHMMEKLHRGASVMEVLHAARETSRPAGATYYGPVFQGDVAGSNVAIASPNAKQSIATTTTNGADVNALIAALKADPGQVEAVEEAQSLKDELALARPKSGYVKSLLKNLSHVALAAGYVNEIKTALGY